MLRQAQALRQAQGTVWGSETVRSRAWTSLRAEYSAQNGRGGEHGSRRAARTQRQVELSPAAAELQRDLSERLDTRVLVSEGRSKGRIVIEFAGPDDLERIADLLT